LYQYSSFWYRHSQAALGGKEGGVQPEPRVSVRLGVWIFHITLPMLGLWLLIAQPQVDVAWEHHGIHFWLVISIAALNIGIGIRMGDAARRRADARLFLVSLAFLAAAGFLFLHSLATPGVLLSGRNVGFIAATPVGLLIAAVFALGSSIELTPERSAAVMRRQALLRGGLLAAMVAWGIVSVAGLSPLGPARDAAEGAGPIAALAFPAVGCYTFAAARYYLLYRRRRAVLLISILTAFVLLAEALVTLVLANSWHLSWWGWHILMTAAFGFVAYSAYAQYQREGASAGLFDGIGLEQTVRRIREEHSLALETLVAAMHRQEETGRTDDQMHVITARLATRFGLSEGQTSVLQRAARALADERDEIRRLGALVAVGREASVTLGESEFLSHALARIDEGFARDRFRIGLLTGGQLAFPAELAGPDQPRWEEATGPGHVVLPLTVRDRASGVLEVWRERGGFTERDRSLLQSVGSQLSVALENARLYDQVHGLFRQYMSPDVANALLADPSQAALGGAVVEVTVLFADLRGFTAFCEDASPDDVVDMLNRHFGAATPCVLDNGGTIVQFVGDGFMGVFNAPARQPDHELRAASAALGIQRATAEVAAESGWPRFRVGVNTGAALVGNIGSDQMRSFNVMGDAVNVAARLETLAAPGQVLIGAATRSALGPSVCVETLGEVEVKGRRDPVTAYVLRGLDGVDDLHADGMPR
jgi:class 3 adenylate cyclase